MGEQSSYKKPLDSLLFLSLKSQLHRKKKILLPPPPTTPTTPTTTPPPATTNYTNNIRDPSIFLLRGLIGSYLPTQGSIGGGGGAITPAANDDSGHVVTGRFRVFANESLVRRFIAEMNVVAIDGSSFHNVTITEGDPHRFQVTEGGNATTT